MRVLMTADTVGGVFTYAVDLVRALAPHGVEVHLATRGGALRQDQRQELASLPNAVVYESSLKLEWMEEPWDDVARGSRWLLALARRLRPDVVHLNDYTGGALPFGVPVLVVGHSCVTSWFVAVKGEEAPPSWDRYRAEVRKGLRGADVVVAPGGAMLSALQRHHGPLADGRVVRNGRDPAGFGPAEKEPLILAAGRLWDEAKNLQALGRIAGGLRWPVYVAGELVDPGGKATAAGATRPLGRLSAAELAGWMSRAAIFAHPARYEPFGLAVVEAALSGCALVLGDIPSLRELWDGAALFVPPGEDAALREVLGRLSGDPSLRAQLGSRARAVALDLGPEAPAAAYLELYRELLERRRLPPEAPCGW